MIVSSALFFLIPPALPPSGPVRGGLECLLESADGSYAAMFSFREDAPETEVVPMVGEQEASQAYLQQFPIDGSKLTSINFEADRTITLHAGTAGIMGRFFPITRTRTGEWYNFSTRNTQGDFEVRGSCFGSVEGRLDRPVELTRIHTVRIDKVAS